MSPAPIHCLWQRAGATALLACTLAAAIPAAADVSQAVVPLAPVAHLPDRLELTYTLHYGDASVGVVTKSLTRDEDGTYRQKQHSRPTGMARWFTSSEWFEEGRFEIVNGKIRPLSYLQYREGSSKKHRHYVNFDWQKGIAVNQYGQQLTLPAGAQDQGSIVYSLMLNPPQSRTAEMIYISGGKRLEPYRYSYVGAETLETALGTLRTAIIRRLATDEAHERDPDCVKAARLASDKLPEKCVPSREDFRVWLAVDKNNIPVQIATFEGDKQTTLKITAVRGLK